jgi:hypothetical protein
MKHSHIGSGDIAAIVGYYRPELAPVLCKWKSAGDVWLRLVHDIDLPNKPGMDRGLREENPLRDVYRDNVGPVSGLPGLIVHPRFAWAGGSPDGLGLDRVIELKTHSTYNMDAWGETTFESPTDLVPDKYNYQCQWLMGLCGFALADLLMGFGRDVKFPCLECKGDKVQKKICAICEGTGRAKPDEFQWTETRLYRIPFNAGMFADCERLAEQFYLSHVLTRRAPSVMSVANKRAWKRLFNGNAADWNAEAGGGIGKGAGEDCPGVEG